MVNGFGDRLAEQRIANRLSQKEVAVVLGVNSSMISNYERGERCPTLENLVKLAALYHCSIDYLLTGKEIGKGKWLDAEVLTENQRLTLKMFLKSLEEKE